MDDATVRLQLPDEVPGLLRFARSLTDDQQQAEDLVQDTLARALERADSFRQDSSLATWLHRILHNLAVDRARRRHDVPTEDVAEHIEARWREGAYTVDAADVVARAETRAELQDALSRLPVIYRAAVVLHDAYGLTMAEVAQIAEIGLPAAKQRLRRGRMMLVSALAGASARRAALREVPLTCWDARQQVSDYLDDALDRPSRVRVEQHLVGCPTCPPLYASLVAATDALARSTAPGLTRDPDSVVPSTIAVRINASPRG